MLGSSERTGRTPRIAYSEPTLITAGAATPYRWGDADSGFVDDEVLISSMALHSIIFTMPSGGSFVHSRENPTIFAADIVYVVLSGRLLLADPEHGQLVLAEAGEALFFRRDTWHDGFNRGTEPVRVLELFAPTPAAGASSAYARAQPFLERATYGDDSLIGHWPAGIDERAAGRIRLVPPERRALHLEGDVLWSIVASTEHLHAATGELIPGGTGPSRRYGGDAILHLTAGTILATTEHRGTETEHRATAGDTLVVPQGDSLGLRCPDDTPASFILGVAPAYDAEKAAS
jgi:quercetin dioxygenase-like cupin family protein